MEVVVGWNLVTQWLCVKMTRDACCCSLELPGVVQGLGPTECDMTWGWVVGREVDTEREMLVLQV